MQPPTLDESCVGTRAYRILKSIGVKTLADLGQWTPEQLLALSGFGITTLREVEGILAEHGFALRPSDPRPARRHASARLTEAEERSLLRAYQAGASTMVLAKRYKISAQAIYKRVRDAGIARSRTEAMRTGSARSSFATKQKRIEREWTSAYDAAEFLGLDKSHICALCRGGQLVGAFRLGASKAAPWLIPWESVRAYRERHKR